MAKPKHSLHPTVSITFRPLQPEEITAASQLIDAAYIPQMKKLYGATQRGNWQSYNPAKIKSFVQREPAGVRAGVWQDQLLTLNICRSYGSLGWFHTLAVHPQYQNRGLGRAAVQDAEHYLQQQGVRSIALMTWPTALKNLGFYQKLGYHLGGLTVYAYRQAPQPIARGASPFYATLYASMLPQDAARAQNGVRALCQAIAPGLNYLPWVQWAQQQNFAETLLLWQNGSLRALALSYFWPEAHWVEGKLLLLHPALTLQEKEWVLEHLRLWARAQHRTTFGLPVDLHTDNARTLLLPQHFQLFPESMITMSKGEALPDARHHFVRFGG